MGQESNKVTPERGPVEQSTADASAPSVTTEEIRWQIEHTRAKMSETIDAIQNRLSPARLVTDAKEKAKDGAERAIQVVTSNPVPMTLIGAAVAALTGRNKRTLLLGACSGFACWRAWRAHQSKVESRGGDDFGINPDGAQGGSCTSKRRGVRRAVS
jgi:hypothetical protein